LLINFITGGAKWHAAVQKKRLKQQNLLKKTARKNQNSLVFK
jgi:hypothetical protein